MQSRMMSVRLYIYQKLNISVTTEPIVLYFSWNIPNSPVMVFAIFFGGGTLKAFYFLLGLEASYPSFIESFVGNLSKKI